MNSKQFVKSIITIISLFIIAAIIFTQFYPESRYLDADYITWKHQKDFITKTESEWDVLFLGDSKVRTFVAPDHLGSRSYNISVPAGSAVELYYALVEYLHHHPKPKHVFIGFGLLQYLEPDTFMTKPVLYRYMNLQDIWSASLHIDKANANVSVTARIKHLIDETFFYLKFPSKYMYQITASFFSDSRKKNFDKDYPILEQQRGHLLYIENPSHKIMDSQESRISDFRVSKAIDRYIRKIIELCLQHDIKVHIIQLPIIKEYSAPIFKKQTQQIFIKYLKNLKNRYKSDIDIDLNLELYSKIFFRDSTHANFAGAIRYCSYLKKKYGEIF